MRSNTRMWLLRWNKPDYKLVIGIFPDRDTLYKFFQDNFTPEEILSNDFVIETAPYYEKEWI